MAQRMEEQPEVVGLLAGSVEDKELTLAFQSGDKGAYQAIYDRYSSRVHGVCRRMLGNPHDAQEAAQESFLRIYQALGRFNGRYQLGAWIARITTNVCLDHLRARARRPSDVARLEAIELDDDRQDIDGPEFLVIRSAESRRVRKVLGELPPLHRAAIVLRDFEGLSYVEIAIALERTEGQVKALIHRARQNFKRSWTPLSLLLPWRLLARLREVDVTTRDHLSQAAASSGQVVPVCTTAMQQCGQFMAERVAPIFTAAVLGAAVGGAAVVKSSSPPATGDPQAPVAVLFPDKPRSSSSSTNGGPPKGLRLGVPHGFGPAGPPEEQRAAGPSIAASKASPSPSATASPTPESSPSPTPKPGQPTDQPAQPTDHRPSFVAALGFAGDPPPSAMQPRSNRTSVDCDPVRVKQRLETTFSHGPDAYPAVLSLTADGSRLDMQLSIWKDGREIYYTGQGGLSGGSRNGLDLVLEFSGTYRTGNQEAQDALGLPGSGTFESRLALDCTWSEATSESVTFSGE